MKKIDYLKAIISSLKPSVIIIDKSYTDDIEELRTFIKTRYKYKGRRF